MRHGRKWSRAFAENGDRARKGIPVLRLGRGNLAPPDRRPTAADWLARLEEHEVEIAVLNPHADRELVRHLRMDPEWVVEGRNGEAILIARRPPRDDAADSGTLDV